MNFAEMIKRKEERKAALVAKSEKCENVEELRYIHEQITALNEDLAELRAAQKAQEEEHRNAKSPEQEEAEARTAAVNEEAPEKRNKQPEFVPGQGFKPSAQEGRSAYDSAFEKREQAGKELKENRSVNSPLSITGEIRVMRNP